MTGCDSAVAGRRALRETVRPGAALVVLLASVIPVAAGSPRGVVVESVPATSSCGETGLSPGDVVFGWRQGSGADRAEGALGDAFDWRWLEVERAPRGPVTLQVERSGRRSEVVLLPGTRGPSLWRVTVRPAMPRAVERAYLEGMASLDTGSTEAAVAAWDRLLERRSVRREPVLNAWLLVRAGRALLDAGEGARACALFEGAAAVADRAGDERAAAAVRDEWGRALFRTGEYERALAVHRDGLELRGHSLRETLWVAAAVHDLGTMTLMTGDLEGAVALLEEAVRIRGRLAPDSLAEAESANNLGLALVYLGRFDPAEQRLARALSIREQRSPGSIDVAAGYNNLGLVAKERGDFDAAERFYLRDLELSQRLEPDSEGVAVTLMNLGAVAWERGDLDLAEARFRESLAIVDRLDPDGINVAANLNNLALVAEQRGDLVAAESSLRRALSIWQARTPGSQDVASALLNLGLIAWRRKDLDAAEDLLRRSWDQLQEISPDNHTSALVLLMLGDVELERGRVDRAEAFYRDSLALRERIMPDSPEIAANLINLAAVAERRGDLDGAERLLEQALARREPVSPDSLWVAASLHGLGEVARKRGELAAAQARLERALTIRARLAPGSTEEAESLYRLAQVARQGGRLEEAAARYEAALSALEEQSTRLGGSEEARAGFRARFAQVYRELIEVQLLLGRPDEAFSTLERSRAQLFLATLAERDIVFSGDLPEELERRRRRVAWEYDRTLETIRELDPTADREQVEEAVRRIGELRRRRQEIADEVRAASPRLASLQYPRPLDTAAARAALAPGTLVLAFSVGETSSSLFTLSREEGLAVHELAVTGDELRDAVSAWRSLIIAGGADELARPAHAGLARKLHELLLRPAAAEIGRAERLVIVPDGPLHALSFAALVVASEDEVERYLVEDLPLSVALSVTVLEELTREPEGNRRGPGEWRVVGFADPDYGGVGGPATERVALLRSLSDGATGLEPLPGSRDEVEALEQLWQERAEAFVGTAATERRVLAESRGADVLHLACHGLLDEDFPLDSALALAAPGSQDPDEGNGLLQAWEIFERMRVEADVVTLSACQTGLGRELGGEGLVGLTRAFQYAGASSVVASLWSVSDLSTARLMASFYRRLRSGAPTSEALRGAQLDLLRDAPGETGPDRREEWRHPFFWAAFQVAGDWR